MKNQSKGKQVAWQIGKTIYSGFPHLWDKIMQLSDPRKRKDYSLTELVMGGIMLFVFKEGIHRNIQRRELAECP